MSRLSLPLVLLLGCAAPQDPGVDTGAEIYTEEQVEIAFYALNFIGELPNLAYGLAAYADGGCPVVTESEDTLTLTGDCAWAQGELLGSVSFGATAVIWDGWSMSLGDGTVITADGTQLQGIDGAVSAELHLTAHVVQMPLLPAGDHTVDYLALSTLQGATGVSFSGGMDIAGVDRFQVSGDFSDQGRCDLMIDHVDLTLRGVGSIHYATEAEPCDACLDWSIAEGGAGQLCLGQ
ncbi:MAG: hypothetical protein JXX28_12520 [Deltaproteobacteria bacterium]|nr:hypothetical protein [Deltaproteobacteria bacterium]